MNSKKPSLSATESWNGHKSFKDSPSLKQSDFHTNGSKISPRSGSSSSLSFYSPAPSSPSPRSWESAFNDVIGVLRIQYRNDREVLSYLTDSGKIKQLQYSTAAKMEWNRRLIKEERDAGIFCPTRARRLAKEVAIDYIRRYLDGEEERLDMMNKIQTLEEEKDHNMTVVIDMEDDLKRFKKEKERQITENAKLIEEMLKLRRKIDSLTTVNETLREGNNFTKDENDNFRKENSLIRDESKKLRIENQGIRDENGSLRNENQKVRQDNEKLRKNFEDVREENSKIRTENQELRDENTSIRCESLKYRENNLTLRDENERLRAKNEDLLKDIEIVVEENLGFRSKQDELKLLVNSQLGLLSDRPRVKDRKEETHENV